MRNKRMIPQHEVLRTPQGWTGQERDLIVQLERVHDDIYRRFRKLGMDDLDDGLQSKINDEIGWNDYTTLESGANLNSLTKSGLYYIKTGVQNAPGSWGALINAKLGGAQFQLFYNRSNLMVRDYTGNPPNWGAWKQATLETVE